MLWGLVVGDCLGSPIQFSGKDNHPWTAEMVECPALVNYVDAAQAATPSALRATPPIPAGQGESPPPLLRREYFFEMKDSIVISFGDGNSGGGGGEQKNSRDALRGDGG